MIRLITESQALKMMLVLLVAVFCFHLLVLFGIVPYSIVWAGRLKSTTDMYIFEAISILINAILFYVLLLKGNYIRHRVPERIVNSIILFFIALFLLNTAANFMATTFFERVIFTPLTLLSAVLLLIISWRPAKS